MELSAYLRSYARTIHGKQQLIIASFAKALECIPRQLADNAGFDATDLLNKLRMRHAQGHTWDGIDIETESVADNMERFVWEPSIVKINALNSAAEAACLILSVDETIKNETSEKVSDSLRATFSATRRQRIELIPLSSSTLFLFISLSVPAWSKSSSWSHE